MHVWMSHVTHTNESCRTCKWVMSHIWMCHVSHMNESCHTWWILIAMHVWMSHGIRINESRHTHEWVMSHIWMSHVDSQMCTFPWNLHRANSGHRPRTRSRNSSPRTRARRRKSARTREQGTHAEHAQNSMHGTGTSWGFLHTHTRTHTHTHRQTHAHTDAHTHTHVYRSLLVCSGLFWCIQVSLGVFRSLLRLYISLLWHTQSNSCTQSTLRSLCAARITSLDFLYWFLFVYVGLFWFNSVSDVLYTQHRSLGQVSFIGLFWCMWVSLCVFQSLLRLCTLFTAQVTWSGLFHTGWQECIRCLIFAGHLVAKVPYNQWLFCAKTPQLKAFYVSLPPRTSLLVYTGLFWDWRGTSGCAASGSLCGERWHWSFESVTFIGLFYKSLL